MDFHTKPTRNSLCAALYASKKPARPRVLHVIKAKNILTFIEKKKKTRHQPGGIKITKAHRKSGTLSGKKNSRNIILTFICPDLHTAMGGEVGHSAGRRTKHRDERKRWENLAENTEIRIAEMYTTNIAAISGQHT